MSQEFHGEERQIKRVSGAAIDGAPITYVIALAAVVAALAAVPLSIVIGTGKSFPLSQAIYPLAGWLLGPVAGGVADGVGALVGTWLFPQTTTVPVATIFGIRTVTNRLKRLISQRPMVLPISRLNSS